MLAPLIERPGRSAVNRPRERGVTMALVALAIFSIIAMAALSIDIGTLYEASAEAQRSADAAALAGARVLSLSGMTGDPTNKSGDWSLACNAATLAAQAAGSQNTVGGTAPTVATPTYAAADGSSCTSAGNYAFGVNPTVTVKVTQSNLPTYFSRIWGSTGSSVSATATAEVFNPSNSGSFAPGGQTVPVQPRCVKPWIVPNQDPGNLPGQCTGEGCPTFVGPLTGPAPSSITNGGILGGGAGTGVIGETFNLAADCAATGTCNSATGPTAPYFASPPQANGPNITTVASPYLEYLPGQVLGAPKAAPSCASGLYQQAIAGCDQTTPYQCGVQASSLGSSANLVDLAENPVATGDTANAAACLTKSGDTLNTSAYPYQILAGGSNPLGVSGPITSSNSIVSFPIYDDTQPLMINGSTNQAPVTIVGFLQVFINQVNPDGSLNVTVLNVAGCGEGVSSTNPGYINGTSPVPVRLITPP
jgi:Flp pilus assembly protein TadG